MTRARRLALLLSACLLSAGPARAADRLSVMLDWLPNPDEAPLFVAQHEGFFARHQLDIDLIAPSDAATPAMMAATGHVDVAITYQPSLYLLTDRHVPVVRFATLVDTPLDSIIALKPGPIHRLADLRGRTLGFSTPGVEEALAHAMVASAGLRADEVRLVDVRFQIVSAVMTHRVDATISAYRNKEIHELAAHGLQATEFLPEQNGVPAYDELIYVTRRASAHDPRLARFVAALRDSTAWLLAHPEQGWSDFTADYPAQDAPVVHAEWLATLSHFATSPGSLDGPRYVAFGRFMQAQGMIASAPRLDDIAVRTGDVP